jgi:hypothetical protein
MKRLDRLGQLVFYVMCPVVVMAPLYLCQANAQWTTSKCMAGRRQMHELASAVHGRTSNELYGALI